MNQSNNSVKSITSRGMLVFGLYWVGYCSYIAFTVTTLLDYGWRLLSALYSEPCP